MTDLRGQQRKAMLDLAVLAMYLDGNLARVEDGRVKVLLAAMGLDTDYDRGREFDAAVTRVRPHTESPAAAQKHALSLAALFTTEEERKFLDETLSDMVASDGGVTDSENRFLAIIKSIIKD